MPSDGPAFYDDDAVFESYMARRRRPGSPNDTLEKPVIDALIGEVNGQRILDLGCGDAGFGRESLARGCASYLGIEGSINMVRATRETLEGTSGQVEHATMEKWAYPRDAFDLVVSRLALHYVKDVEAVFEKVYRALVAGGRFVFSVEHPVITSCDRGWNGEGPRQEWIVDEYFKAGRRVTEWMDGEVVKYHRTIEGYFGGLQRAGFVVENLREAEPQQAHFKGHIRTFRRRQRIPLFLIMSGRKPD